ncbi:hypothetical protein SAMN05216390_101206 [Lachnospiraceae bacterium KH1T2]|nr:hypothetical protein SAMN05216390_101206 [Lachnospiraceae bacterium KH1T2]
MSKFDEFRENYQTFEYRDYHWKIEDGLCKVVFDFAIPGLSEFHPTWEFPVGRADLEKKNIADVLDVLVFNLGMTETISYYKITCAPKAIVKCGYLSDSASKWWRKLYYNGLGEFMYRNGIEVSEEELVEIVSEGEKFPTIEDDTEYKGFLIPVGGGKDSVVSLEVLKDEDVSTYHINNNSSTLKVIEVFNEGKTDLCAKRTLDQNMLELNKQGFLNGHTPFSAIVAFSSYITAFLNGKKYIALSNETSANESTVKGSFVNHQYSKSYEFEKDFDDYVHSLVTSDIKYFSFLRPLAEIQIAALFSQYKKYHSVFRSCNVGSKKGIWCCDCPKCLFVYIILSPFLEDAELVDIFGENLLDKESLDKDFRELSGIDENKPFECVGTRSEVVSALHDFEEKGRKSLLTERYKSKLTADTTSVAMFLNRWETMNYVPEEYQNKLREALKRCIISMNT